MLGADLLNDLLDLLVGKRAASAIIIKCVVQFTREFLDFELLDDAAQQRQPGAAQAGSDADKSADALFGSDRASGARETTRLLGWPRPRIQV